jgi:hypothetical protein
LVGNFVCWIEFTDRPTFLVERLHWGFDVGAVLVGVLDCWVGFGDSPEFVDREPFDLD